MSLRSVRILFLVALTCLSPAFAADLTLEETEATISILQGDQVVLVYNKQPPPLPDGVDPVYRRSGFLHPLNTPSGRTVTAVYPEDHLHQNGFFTAWVNTTYDGKKVDFWNLGKKRGRVIHSKVLRRFDNHEGVGFEVRMLHQTGGETPVSVLQETWKVTVRRRVDACFCVDVQTTQEALTDKPLIINEFHYGGVALRGLTRWVQPAARGELPDGLIHESSAFLNDRGSNRTKGNHEKARWVALTGKIDGADVSAVVLGHSTNPRAPQTARLHPKKPYFCFAPCVEGSFSIDRHHPWSARYRILLVDSAPNSEWLDEQWGSWAGQEE